MNETIIVRVNDSISEEHHSRLYHKVAFSVRYYAQFIQLIYLNMIRLFSLHYSWQQSCHFIHFELRICEHCSSEPYKLDSRLGTTSFYKIQSNKMPVRYIYKWTSYLPRFGNLLLSNPVSWLSSLFWDIYGQATGMATLIYHSNKENCS